MSASCPFLYINPGIVVFLPIIGASLSEPHNDHDNGTHVRSNAIYLSIYVSFTPHLLHPGSRDPYTPKNALCIPVYWHALPWRLSTKTGSWMRRHMVETASAYWDSAWSCSCPATCQHACVNQKRLMSLLYCCFVTFMSTKARLTTVPACYLWM